MRSFLNDDRTREAWRVFRHVFTRALALVGALAWMACGAFGLVVGLYFEGLPDTEMIRYVEHGQTVGQERQLFLGLAVFFVVIGIRGYDRLRDWFRPAATL